MEKKLINLEKKKASEKNGEFNQPAGITVNTNSLYICDSTNNRIQVIDKENGKFIHLWDHGEISIYDPRSILLNEELLYVGDNGGIQVFTKWGQFIQLFGRHGSGPGEFTVVTSVCIVNDKLFCIDHANHRIQVWN